MERWNSGRELGCVLCQLVSLAVADIGGSSRPQCNAAQLSITPTRQDFPHGIFVLGLSGEEGRWKIEWQVELYATAGTKKPCCPSVLPAFHVTFGSSKVFISLTLLDTLNPLPGLPLRRDITPIRGSAECLSLVREWLWHCKNKHGNDECSGDPPNTRLPSRILDIKEEPPRLIEPAATAVVDDQCADYVALSRRRV